MSKTEFAARAAGGALLGLALMALAAAAPAPPSVTIDNFTFNPDPVVVRAGAQVIWTNGDDVPHALRATDGSFRSKALDTGDSYAFTFARPGVYTYFCSIHPKMVGKVIVKAP
jgi:plastocyanin